MTHIESLLSFEDGGNLLTVNLYNMYLELEKISPIIDGDLVVQGTVLNPNFGPSLCVIDFLGGNDDEPTEISRIPPWNMMYTPPQEGELESTFAIPVTIAQEHRGGSIRVSVFVDEVARIPYGEEDPSVDLNTLARICALRYVTQAVEELTAFDAEFIDEAPQQGDDALFDDFQPPETDAEFADPSKILFIHSIKIALDYDDLMAHKADGYELHCVNLTEEGTADDQDHMWKFHVLAKYGPAGEDGVEDIVWLSCPKGVGTLPVLRGYEVLHDYDLTDIDDAVSEGSCREWHSRLQIPPVPRPRSPVYHFPPQSLPA